MIYVQNIDGNKFFYDSEESNLQLAIWVDGPEGLKRMVEVMLKAPKFLGSDRKLHSTDKEREMFFLDYIPRVFGQTTGEVKKYKSIEEVEK